jgi:hypothetical protein
MDLFTVKEKINLYEYVDSFVEDIRQIWENCLEFNLPGSDIVSWCESLSDTFDQLLLVC